MDNLSNRVIKGYELRECLGEGGFGSVYRAYQSAIGREVAIKVILPQHANHPDFVRRFELEAQLIARLEHPHIVPLYDYWRDPDGAFLVMRWLQGSLRAAIQRGPWSVEAAARLLDQIASALTIAHREGVIHRDIKPDNILLDEDENAYLADFGIAKDLSVGSMTEEGALIGSPAYITPEQIKGESITPRADIYSLGLVMYEILVSEKPFATATTPYQFINHHLNTPIPSLNAQRPNLPATLNEILQTATAKDPAQRYANVARFAAAFRAAIPTLHRASHQPLVEPLTERELDILRLMVEGLSNREIAERLVVAFETVRWYLRQIYTKLDVHGRRQAIQRALQLQLTDGEANVVADASSGLPSAEPVAIRSIGSTSSLINPYKGLRAFQETDAADFFGRAALTEQLLGHLTESGDGAHFLAVVGPSGSGKSSVVKAGLLPALRRGALPTSARWFITDMLPGTHPLEELEVALLRIAVNPLPGLIEQLKEDRRGLIRAAKRVLPPDQDVELLLVIDQFEELFTLVADESLRTHFIDNLLSAASDPRSRVRIVLTLRADFYDRPLSHPRLAELMRSHTEVVLPLRQQELERAIAGPAERAGLVLEPGLVNVLISDIGEQPGMLPLLQYALTELYERREDYTLTLDAYRASGGISGALARRADELYEELEPEAQAVARQLFLRLVTLGEAIEDTRRRVVRTEFDSIADSDRSIEEVINAFGQYRLLTFDRDPVTRGPTIEIAHEALIREWTRLQTWLDESRDDLRVQRRLMAAAEEWVHSKHDASFLASGVRLTQFEALADGNDLALNQLEREYLRTSITQREAQQAEETARQERELTLAHQAVASQRRAANRLRYAVIILIAAALGAFVLTGFAVRSEQSAVNAEATSAGRLNLFSDSENRRLAAAAESLAQTGNSQDAELAALLSLQALKFAPSFAAYSALNDANASLYQQQVFTEQDIVSSVAFSADGRMALVGSRDGTVHERNAQTGQTVRVIPGSGRLPVFSGDGKFVLTGLADGTAALWDVDTGQQLRVFKTIDAWNSGVFSPDDRYLLTGSLGTAQLWDTTSGELVRAFSVGSAVTSVALSSDGRLALTGSRDKLARLWDVASGQQVQVFTGHDDAVSAVAFSPDGKMVATASRDYTVRLWDVPTGKELHRLTNHTAVATSVAFSPDGTLVASGGFDHALFVWDAASSALLHTILGDTDSVTSVAFSSDSESILSGSADKTARLWNLQTPSGLLLLKGHTDSVEGMTISADDKYVVTGSADGTAILWNAKTGRPIHTFVGQALALSPGSSPNLAGVAISPDNRYVFMGGAGIKPGLWDLATGQPIRAFAWDPPAVTGAAFSPDGKHIVSLDGLDNKATLYDAVTGQSERVFEANSNVVRLWTVAFSTDGKYVLSGGSSGSNSDDTIGTLWDVATGQVLRTVVGTGRGVFDKDAINPYFGYDAESSADGKYIFMTVEEKAKLFDATTGKELRAFVGHTMPLSRLALSPDGKYALTLSIKDNTTRLWDASTGQTLRIFPLSFIPTVHNNGVIKFSPVGFSHNGKYLVADLDTNTPEIVNLDFQGAVEFACSRLSRDLTDDERTKYSIVGTQPSCLQFDQSGQQTPIVLPTWTPIPTGALPVWTPLPTATAPVTTPLAP
ncbi:MAG TPA: protein kinase [Aggregatilineales bacterium]|nr:protein kinase [Aggregatilineales bacterium]